MVTPESSWLPPDGVLRAARADFARKNALRSSSEGILVRRRESSRQFHPLARRCGDEPE